MPFFKKQEPITRDLADDIRPTRYEEKCPNPISLDHDAGHFTHDEHYAVDLVLEKRVIRTLDFNVVPLVLVLCK